MESTDHSEEIDFQKYWLVLKRRWLPAVGVFGIVFSLTAVIASLQKPVYQAEGKLLFKADRSSELTGLKNNIGELVRVGDKSDPLSTETEILASYSIAQETVKTLGLKDKKGKPLDPKSLLKRLKVKTVTGTDVLQINYQDDDPKVAATVVNKVMEVYIQNNIINNQAKANAARIFITKELPSVENTLRQADAALRKFKEDNKVVSLKEEASAAVGALTATDNKIAELQAQLANVTAQSESLRNQLGLNREEAIAVSSLSQSPGVQEPLKELQKIQNQLAVERARFLNTDPTVVNLQQKEAELSALVQERVDQVLGNQQDAPVKNLQIGELKQKLTADLVQSEVQRSGLSSQLSVLYNTQSAYKNRSSILPQLEQIQKELERRVEASQTGASQIGKNIRWQVSR